MFKAQKDQPFWIFEVTPVEIWSLDNCLYLHGCLGLVLVNQVVAGPTFFELIIVKLDCAGIIMEYHG